MNQDELLVALCKTLLAETERQPGWSKLIMVGEMDGGSAGMAGYSFDLSGQWKATSPRGGESLDLLEQLHEAMTAASPTGRPWLACLLRIGNNGEVGADFEYDDAERWAINPRNLEQRIAVPERGRQRGVVTLLDGDPAREARKRHPAGKQVCFQDFHD